MPTVVSEHLPSRYWGALPRLLRFLIVGGINTVFGYGAYALLLFIGLHYAAAAFVGTILGVLFNFVTTGHFVFDEAPSGAMLVRFFAVYAVMYLFNVAALTFLQNIGIGPWRPGPYGAGLALVIPMSLLSYVLMRQFVFGGQRVAR